MSELKVASHGQKVFLISAPADRDLAEFEEALKMTCTKHQLSVTIPRGAFTLFLDAEMVDIVGAVK